MRRFTLAINFQRPVFVLVRNGGKCFDQGIRPFTDVRPRKKNDFFIGKSQIIFLADI
mgnify:CR=1 FL=1